MAIIIPRSTGNYNFLKCQQSPLFRNADNKCQQLYLSRKRRLVLTITVSKNASNYNFQKCQKLYVQKCWQLKIPEMLAIIIFRNSKKGQFSEMVAIIISRNVVNYNFQKCEQLQFPEMSAIILTRNAGNQHFQKYSQI